MLLFFLQSDQFAWLLVDRLGNDLRISGLGSRGAPMESHARVQSFPALARAPRVRFNVTSVQRLIQRHFHSRIRSQLPTPAFLHSNTYLLLLEEYISYSRVSPKYLCSCQSMTPIRTWTGLGKMQQMGLYPVTRKQAADVTSPHNSDPTSLVTFAIGFNKGCDSASWTCDIARTRIPLIERVAGNDRTGFSCSTSR